ncbi:MAG: zinc metalloprotease HtpX [Dehalococcoidia bacterium]
MWLQTRMYLLVALMFGIVYGMLVAVSSYMGVGSFLFYGILAVFIMLIQYLMGPAIVGWSMKVKWVSEKDYPDLHRMVAELAQGAGIKKPKVGIAQIPLPNAFAYGRTRGDARVCVTDGILKLLSQDELRAVMAHEISHVKHRDMAIITILSIIPMILWYVAWGTMWSGGGRRQGGGGSAALIGLGAFLLYFITNLLVLYASRIREYYADLGAVRLGSRPRFLATALYKLVYGNARVPKESLKKVEGLKAFFVNDPSRAWNEVRDLKQVDEDMTGVISYENLASLRSKEVRIGTRDHLMEVFSTHPNMLKRITHLSSLIDRL